MPRPPARSWPGALVKWKLRCRPVATSLEEAGERLFTFVRYPPERSLKSALISPSRCFGRMRAKKGLNVMLVRQSRPSTPAAPPTAKAGAKVET
jgi:hypothetical protein